MNLKAIVRPRLLVRRDAGNFDGVLRFNEPASGAPGQENGYRLLGARLPEIEALVIGVVGPIAEQDPEVLFTASRAIDDQARAGAELDPWIFRADFRRRAARV